MRVFQVLVLVAWLAVVYVTAMAFRNEGFSAATEVFANDMAAMNWRSQFNIDLLANLALVGLWAAWRDRFSVKGIVAGLCCCFGGSLVSFAYILVLSLTAKGDMKQLVTGRQ